MMGFQDVHVCPVKERFLLKLEFCKILVPKLVFWVWAVEDSLNLVQTSGLGLYMLIDIILSTSHFYKVHFYLVLH